MPVLVDKRHAERPTAAVAVGDGRHRAWPVLVPPLLQCGENQVQQAGDSDLRHVKSHQE